MKRLFLFLILWFGFSVSLLGQYHPEFKTVLPESLKVYALPQSNSGIIVHLESGTLVGIQDVKNGWLKVTFPRTLEVWVASCFLKDGKFTDGVIFRVGPSAAASALTVENKIVGETADIREEAVGGFWKKIRLTAQFSGYVLRDTLYPVQKEFRLQTPGKPDARQTTVVGRLLPLEKPLNGATHKLVYQVHKAEHLVAYVLPEKVNLNLWEDWTIYLSGEILWDSGIRTPFIKVANIFPAYR